jgi:hypothetical protein
VAAPVVSRLGDHGDDVLDLLFHPKGRPGGEQNRALLQVIGGRAIPTNSTTEFNPRNPKNSTDFSTSTGQCAHPMKENVKKKLLPAPSSGGAGAVVTYIQPPTSPWRRGFAVGRFWAHRAFPRRGQPLLIPTRRFHKTVVVRRPFGSEATQAKRWLKCQP